jgi:uncharacterized Zn finger protein (UPF0148 family)
VEVEIIRCNECGAKFIILGKDYQDEGDIYCPSCGQDLGDFDCKEAEITIETEKIIDKIWHLKKE